LSLLLLCGAAFPEGVESSYLRIIQKELQRAQLQLDPRFVLALVRAESDFDRLAISSRGAAGPCQIMPDVAQELGLRAYMSFNLLEARRERRRALSLRRKALAELACIDARNPPKRNRQLAERVRRLWEEASLHDRRARKLFERYRSELLAYLGEDERFQIPKALRACVRLLAQIQRAVGDDLRMIAAAYNAGLTRVLKEGGIPFMEETVRFQNRVMRYYREYRGR